MNYNQDDLRSLQQVELEILLAIDRVCQNNNITYFLDSGTLLGAVRHKGFIPWDDDIDIGMARSEYDRFKVVAAQELGPSFVVVEPTAHDNIAGLFMKVWKKGTKFYTQETIEADVEQGIFVDIFPYDPLHTNPGIAAKQKKKCRLWQSLSYLYHAKTMVVPHKGLLGAVEHSACTIAHYGVRAFLSHERIVNTFMAWAKKGEECPSDNWLNMVYVTDSFPSQALWPPTMVQFEGYTFPAPAEPHIYLGIMYGAHWHELPPVEERRNHAPKILDFGD